MAGAVWAIVQGCDDHVVLGVFLNERDVERAAAAVNGAKATTDARARVVEWPDRRYLSASHKFIREGPY